MISIGASAVISNASFPTMSTKYGLSISKAVCLIFFWNIDSCRRPCAVHESGIGTSPT